MQSGVLRTLEFDRIVDALRDYALTPMGADRLERLTPSVDLPKVANLLASTSEAVAYIVRNGEFPLRGSGELTQVLDALVVEGRALEPVRLLALGTFLESVEDSRLAIRRLAESFPLLDQTTAATASFKSEIGQVRDKITPAGEVADHASPELRSIRDRLRKQRTRLRGTLESYLRGKETAKYLQDQVVTERNGRYVIVVKAEHRTSIPGIVHGASTSGASLFLEPLSTVEINNDIVALEEQEAEEVRRILLALTNLFRGRPLDLKRTIDVAVELDVLQAKARFSELLDAVQPTLTTDGAFELQAARHPLLVMAAKAAGARPVREPSPAVRSLDPGARIDQAAAATTGSGGHHHGPVPVTIRIVPPSTVLLISGPNTGGKTVALKTAGLLALMAQSGLRIPAADGSRLPVYRSIFADIGDEQSIDASLSTFSGHVANIAAMDRSLTTPALVLLDEVGSGTDPVEGGALGVAVVDHFRRRGASLIATSHYDALKTYASTTDGVTSAAFGFAAETFAPTYELRYGSPGRSLALEVAARLGLNASIISAARQNVSAREAQLAEHLARMDRDLRALEHEQRLLARERETLESVEARMREREEVLKDREQTFRQRLSEELESEVRRARREIDDVIADLKVKTETIARDAAHIVTTGDTGSVRGEARAAVDAVAKRALAPEPEPEPTSPGRRPVVGDRVAVGMLGLEGVITGIHDGSVEVDVRGKRMRASIRDLRVLDAVAKSQAQPARISVHVDLQPRESAPTDLNLIGCTVDEALTRVERFLDESLLSDQRVVRVIHGYGTGQLKRALTGYLEQHPLVARLATAPPEQGGGGVTVVELKE